MRRWQPGGPIDMRGTKAGKPRYPNRRVKREVRGELKTFDSKGEADRFRELELMERAGLITGLDRQVTFSLDVVRTSFVEQLVDALEQFARRSVTARALEARALIHRYRLGLATVHVANWKADATYVDKRGKVLQDVSVVEDYKDNILTEEFYMKRALMEATRDVRVLEVGPRRTRSRAPRRVR